jgi:hypothetical protein
MRAVLTEPFAANLIASPPEVQKAFGKQLTNLLRDLRHPSLRAKKYEERRGLWQARINDDWRMYFTIEGDAYASDHTTPQVACSRHLRRASDTSTRSPAIPRRRPHRRVESIGHHRPPIPRT